VCWVVALWLYYIRPSTRGPLLRCDNLRARNEA
jgi:hypothetical protein